MTLLRLLARGTPTAPMVDRMLTITDRFTGSWSDPRGVTGRGPLKLPHGSPGGFRMRFPALAGQTIRARIEGGPEVTWGGASQVTAGADGPVWSDHVPLNTAPRSAPILRTYTTSTTSGSYATGSYDERVSEWGWGDYYTTPGAWGYVGYGPMAMPDAVVGPLPASAVSCLLVGDSIVAGARSYVELGARLAPLPGHNVGTGGEGAAGLISTIDAKLAGLEYAWWTHVIHQHAVNDLADTGWAMGVKRISAWRWAQSKGLRSIQLTCLPASTSSDGWTTAEGQTPRYVPQIVDLNAWLRDGAPLTAGAPADPGTIGAVRVGHPDHPLDAVWDTATTAYPPGYVDRWRVPGWTGDGIHPNDAAHAGLAPVAAAYMRSLPC